MLENGAGRGHGRAHHRRRPRDSTRTAGRSGTPWSRSGRPTPPAATTTRATSTTRRSTPTSAAWAGSSRTPTAGTATSPSAPAPIPGATTTTPGGRTTSTTACSGTGFAQRMITQMYFPGDPLLPLDPIFNTVAGRGGARPPRRDASTSTSRSPSTPSATASTSCCAAARRRRWRTLTWPAPTPEAAPRGDDRLTAQPDGRALLAPGRLPGMGGPATRHSPTPADGERIVLDRHHHRRRRRPRAPTPWWRSGTPIPRAATRRRRPAFQGYGRCATDKEGGFRFTTLKPGPVPAGQRATRSRRRTSRWRSSPAGCCSTSPPACTSRASR